MRIERNGNITYSGTIGSASDNRIKHNEELISDALDTILKLKPKHYIKTGKKLSCYLMKKNLMKQIRF